ILVPFATPIFAATTVVVGSDPTKVVIKGILVPSLLSSQIQQDGDIAPIDALRGKPIGIVAMGARSHHYLGVDWHLRTVLAWFGALVMPTGVYLESAHFQNGRLA